MHVFESARESPIRVVQRFLGRVRLYRLKPDFQLVGEWKFQKCALLEIPNLSVENGNSNRFASAGGSEPCANVIASQINPSSAALN
jgi:hypothetical protein